MGEITIRTLGEPDFLGLERAWNDLHCRSEADPLFCSWEWLSTWWRYHRDEFGLGCQLIAASDGESLVGLAPMHSRMATQLGMFRSHRLELMGNVWRESSTVMSERTSFVVDARRPEIHAMLAGALLDLRGWDELLVCHTDTAGPTAAALSAALTGRGMFHRITDEMPAYHLPLVGTFAEFLKGLSPKTRRRLYNERRKLEEMGEVRWEDADGGQIDDFLKDLDVLHESRWGWRASVGRRGAMYREIAGRLAQRGALSLTRLSLGGRAIAISLDFRAGGRQYGIQKAVDTQFSTKISPGFLETGYNLESAYRDGVLCFDELGGQGKSDDYKAKLGAVRTVLGCVHIVRSPVLALAHRLNALRHGFTREASD